MVFKPIQAYQRTRLQLTLESSIRQLPYLLVCLDIPLRLSASSRTNSAKYSRLALALASLTMTRYLGSYSALEDSCVKLIDLIPVILTLDSL